jgi:hypothetical protein
MDLSRLSSKEGEATGGGPLSRAARSACGMEVLIGRKQAEGKAWT